MADLKNDYNKYADIDEDEILKNLTEEQLEELAYELDPDNNMLPASERQRPQTKKAPTGDFSRQKLLDFLEKKAKEEKDWDEKVPYNPGQKRGKVYEKKEDKKKDEEKTNGNRKQEEWENELEGATEEDLVELAGILGLHSMLDQEQYAASQRSVLGDDKIVGLDGERMKFSAVTKASLPKDFTMEPPNTTDVEGSIKKLKANDKELKNLNLNNIKEIKLDVIKEVFAAAGDNTVLESLSMASTGLADKAAAMAAEVIKKNSTLKSMNLESNFITSEGMSILCKALANNTSLTEFRVANQRSMMGSKGEQEYAIMLEKKNKTLLKLGLAFEHAGPRSMAQDALMRNNEAVRTQKSGKK
ncbi:tropomodulin-1-like [Lytechinus pictus]|uniref:tropomodulin-1-like n=1 Tax=Lytechinus pictus TaxID=7653 RepID=UPI0030B9F237